MAFSQLFNKKPEQLQLFQIETTTKKPPRKPSKKDRPRGCEVCPLNKIKGIKKIFGQVTGKPFALFAQSPGPDENDEGIELIGKAGQWWWDELRNVGLKRSMFDIQNVVRCFPADWVEGSYSSYLQMRNPTTDEIHCCSIHTDNIIPKLKARQILVLGQIAAKALLQTRSLPANKVFYDERLNAKMYLVDHPSFFARGYASAQRLKAFRDTLKLFAEDAKKQTKFLHDQFSFIKSRDYRLVLTEGQAVKASKILRKYAKRRRISCDIEDIKWKDGRKVIACGFCPKPGLSFVFVFYHKDQDHSDGWKVKQVAKKLLQDKNIKKAFHYGCSDTTKLALYEDIHTQSYDHDTNQSEYLRFSDAKAYGLDAIGERRFPEFSGYTMVTVKDIIDNTPDLPERVKNASRDIQLKYIWKHGLFDVGKFSLETLRLYNGADCDLTKIIEIDNKKHVPQKLLELYIDLSYMLQDMEPNGPRFDFKHNKALAKIYPYRAARLLRKMRKMLKNSKFNPGSPKQVYDAVYKHFGLEYPFSGRKAGKPNTQKKTMLTLGREHPFPLLVLEYRQVTKAYGTYIKGYRRCAKLNKGRLRTKWWSTGTRTGRLSSGGRRDDPGVVNLQNIHNDLQLKNMCIADKRWRKVYVAVKRILEEIGITEEVDLKNASLEKIYGAIENWIKENVPDLEAFLALDYGQIEVRVAALMSGDKNLKRDCQESDIHTRVGVTMTGWPAEKIAHDKKTRTVTKNVHFGILFGIGVDNLYDFVVAMTDPNEQETISREDVEKAYHRYFRRYPGIQRFIDKQREFGGLHKYVETLFGMKQTLNVKDQTEDDDEFYEDDTGDGRTSWWGNQAINGPVQGSAHQFMLCGLINVRRNPEKYKILRKLCMDVHDNLTTFVKVLSINRAYKKMRYLMEHEAINTVKKDFPKIKWDVPIVTEAEAGLRLGCMVELNENITPGEFIFNWFWKCRKQMKELSVELHKIRNIAV